jgi:hypothetical protein
VWYAASYITEHPQILDASIQTILATVIWCLGFLEPYGQNSNVSDNRITPLCGSVFSDVFRFTFSCLQWPGCHACSMYNKANEYQQNPYRALATGWMSKMPGNGQRFLLLQNIKNCWAHPASHWLGIRHKSVEAWRSRMHETIPLPHFPLWQGP